MWESSHLLFSGIKTGMYDDAVHFAFSSRLNQLPPNDAVRKQKKNILEYLFSSVLSQFKKFHPSGNLNFII